MVAAFTAASYAELVSKYPHAGGAALFTHRGRLGAVAGQLSSVASTVMLPTPASAREMMQPSLAVLACSWKVASSRPGTRAVVTRSICEIVGLPSMLRMWTFGLGLNRVRHVPGLRKRVRDLHREAAGQGGADQLLGVGALALLEAAT